MIDYMYCNSELYIIDLINSDLININCYIAIWKYTKKYSMLYCKKKKFVYNVYIYMQLVIRQSKVNFFHFFHHHHKFHEKNMAKKQKLDKYYYNILWFKQKSK